MVQYSNICIERIFVNPEGCFLNFLEIYSGNKCFLNSAPLIDVVKCPLSCSIDQLL